MEAGVEAERVLLVSAAQRRGQGAANQFIAHAIKMEYS